MTGEKRKLERVENSKSLFPKEIFFSEENVTKYLQVVCKSTLKLFVPCISILKTFAHKFNGRIKCFKSFHVRLLVDEMMINIMTQWHILKFIQCSNTWQKYRLVYTHIVRPYFLLKTCQLNFSPSICLIIRRAHI